MKKRLLSLLLVAVMAVGMLAGCGGKKEDETPLVVGYSPFSSKFSPFFAETAYDQDVAGMTQVSLIASDRQGAMIYKGIKGETIKYNGTDYTYYGIADVTTTENEDGTVYYDFTLRDDVKFSDGHVLDVDDVIFSMYVLCDPTYDGASSLYAQPIQGIEDYRSGMESRWSLIFKTERAGYTANDYYTQEQYDAFWKAFDEAGVDFVKEIVAYCVAAGAVADEKDVAGAATAWGYEGLAAEATEADFWAKIVDTYGYDLSDEGINYEKATSSITSLITGKCNAELLAGVKTGDSADSITGIQKTGDNTLRVVMTKVDATSIYQLAVSVTPMHYYGNEKEYDFENNKFGFTKGDLSTVRAKTTEPMGAGPYKFVKFENGVVNFEANENYFKGEPKTKYINFLETQEADKLNGVTTGTIDITDPSYDKNTVDAITKANNGKGVVGDVITTNTVDNLGYGYIGMNSKVMSINGEKDSDASKNLRKAFATILSVYREVAIDSYYGDLATVINYPISNTSWAAPQATDPGYEIAFSKDVEGNTIYTSDMDAEAKYAAAKKAALGYFAAAGYTVTDGKVTAAPEGGKMEYELLIPADGAGDHPSFMICTLAKEALAEIGINLIVTDLSNSSELWTALEAETCAMWCAAWDATVDPDMFQIYHPEGGSNYMYAINDDELTQMILDARATTDQAYRKTMYKACLDIIIDWAVEIPVYQRQNAIIFSTERVNMDTVTPDITTFYGWMSEVENIELNK